MSQTGFNKLLTYKSDTATAIPSAGNLTNSADGAELAVNTADKRLFVKDSGNNVVELGTNPSSLTLPNGTANGVVYANGSKVLTTGSALTFDGSTLTATRASSGYVGYFKADGNAALMLERTTAGTPGTFSINCTNDGNSYIDTSGATGFMIFRPMGTEQMRLNSTGLGIGTSSPGGKLHVADASGATRLWVENTNNAAAGAGIYLRTLNGGSLVSNATVRVDNAGNLGMFTGTSGEALRLTLDSSGNLGLGVTPSAWAYTKALQVGDFSLAYYSGQNNSLSTNSYLSATGGGTQTYIANGYAMQYQQYAGKHIWYTAPSGTAGNAISFTQAMTLDASGNLVLANNKPFAGYNTGGSVVNLAKIDGSNNIYLAEASASVGSVYISTANNMIFNGSGGSERMRIDSSGRVGIGQSAPTGLLVVGDYNPVSGASVTSLYTTSPNNNNLGNCFEWGHNNSSGYRSTLAACTGNGIPFIGFSCEAGTTGNTYRTRGIAGTTISTDNNGAMLFSRITNANADNQSATESMRIDSSGNLLVGKTTTSNSTIGMLIGTVGDSYWTRASGGNYLNFYNSGGTQIGYIQNNGNSTTTYSTSSDYRLKENIQPMQNALATVAQLNPVTYTWKADGSDGQGFIAHELQAVVPDCVTGEKDAVDADGNPVYQGIDTSFLVATLTAAIQELKAELDATKAEVAALKGV